MQFFERSKDKISNLRVLTNSLTFSNLNSSVFFSSNLITCLIGKILKYNTTLKELRLNNTIDHSNHIFNLISGVRSGNSCIETLDISNSKVSYQKESVLFDFLSKLPNLQQLIMNDCNILFDYRGITSSVEMPSRFFSLKIKHLCISNTPISHQIFEVLENICQLKDLEILSLKNCSININIEALLSKLIKNTALTNLDISGNNIKESYRGIFSSLIREANKLKEINLTNTGISNKDVKYICLKLCNAPLLEKLYLCENTVLVDIVFDVIKFSKNHHSLKVFDISRSRLLKAFGSTDDAALLILKESIKKLKIDFFFLFHCVTFIDPPNARVRYYWNVVEENIKDKQLNDIVRVKDIDIKSSGGCCCCCCQAYEPCSKKYVLKSIKIESIEEYDNSYDNLY